MWEEDGEVGGGGRRMGRLGEVGGGWGGWVRWEEDGGGGGSRGIMGRLGEVGEDGEGGVTRRDIILWSFASNLLSERHLLIKHESLQIAPHQTSQIP